MPSPIERRKMSSHTDHIETRRKLKKIPLVKDFNYIVDRCTLSEEEKEILRMHYIEKKNLAFIGDKLGYSERTIKAKHKACLLKILYAL